MIIGIDGNEANVKFKVGVSVYTLNLLKHFQNQANQRLQFKIFLKEKPLANLPKENRYFKYEIVPGKFFWSQFFLPLNLYLKRRVDVFFSPAHYSPRFCPTPTVVTIHDLSFIFFPNDFLKTDLIKLRQWTKYSIKKAKKIIAVSKTTKKDIIKYYQVSEDKIEVIYNGYEKRILHKKLPLKKIKKLPLEAKNYILYVGTLQPRKNITVLIQAFHLFKRLNKNFKLVIVGKKGWLYQDIFSLVKKLGLNNEILFTDYVSDEELVFLYQNACCFVLPSLYEGFGIPILEAMSFDCPVISSFTSSLPEIGGNACLYFNPNNFNELFEKIKLLTENKNLRKELIKKGKERVRLFSWQKCGQETLQVIKSAVSINSCNEN